MWSIFSPIWSGTIFAQVLHDVGLTLSYTRKFQRSFWRRMWHGWINRTAWELLPRPQFVPWGGSAISVGIKLSQSCLRLSFRETNGALYLVDILQDILLNSSTYIISNVTKLIWWNEVLGVVDGTVSFCIIWIYLQLRSFEVHNFGEYTYMYAVCTLGCNIIAFRTQ